MKLEPLFTSEKNILVRLSDGEKINVQGLPVLQFDTACGQNKFYIAVLPLARADVEFDAGIYSEGFLAKLRMALKQLEEEGRFVVIIPCVGTSAPLNTDEAEALIKTMTHTARRIKDVRSVIGFAVPVEFLCSNVDNTGMKTPFAIRFIEEMAVKHEHYVFFADEAAVAQCGLEAELQKAGIVLYSCGEK